MVCQHLFQHGNCMTRMSADLTDARGYVPSGSIRVPLLPSPKAAARPRRAVIVLLSAAVIAVGAAVFVPWWVMLPMPGESYGGPLPPLTAEEAAGRARLEAHVVALAGR